MIIFKDLFRQKEETDKKAYFDYDKIQQETRQKIFFVIQENAFYYGYDRPKIIRVPYIDLRELRYQISKHKGIRNINNEIEDNEAINSWLVKCSVIDFLRTIEIFLHIRQNDNSEGNNDRLQKTIQEINEIFDIDKIGYEIIECKIIRRDSKYLHKETIKQTISLLYNDSFKGPLEEFENALSKYLEKDYKGAILEANKAYESTMKAILTKLKISHNPSDTASVLIKKFYDTGLIFSHTESFTNNLSEILKGLPTIRNKQGGHGQGLDPQKVDKSYAEFALHLCGSFIVFLIGRYEEVK